MTKPNEPAFPIACPIDFQFAEPGLTKREYFAGLAMQGLLAKDALDYSPDGAAQWAVSYADALIAELAKVEPEDMAEPKSEVDEFGNTGWMIP